MAYGSNCAVKPTRILRAAYFRALACEKPALFKPMLYSPAFHFSSGYPLGFLPCAGLRLWVLHRFQAFLACSPCAASATSYHFSSSASLPWRSAFSRFARVVNLGLPVLASVANRSVKPTRLRRAAYFLSLACYAFACPPHRSCRRLSPSPKHALLGRCSAALRGCACGGPGHTVLAWLWAAGYGHTLLMQSLFGAALSSTLPLTRQSS